MVEDNDDARALMREAITAAGGEVEEAICAADARTIVRARLPHVIVSDIAMPDEDGYSFMRSLRSECAELGGTIPSIAYTAFAHPGDKARAQISGFTLHLAKPATAQELISAIVRAHGSAPIGAWREAQESGPLARPFCPTCCAVRGIE